MKIAFFGTWDFSANILKSLISDFNDDLEIWLVVSQPDKPVWRKKILEKTQTKIVAEENNIKILQPEKLKPSPQPSPLEERELDEFFEQLKWFDFIVVVAYWKIVPLEVLNAPKFGCINIHWSILPKYRWASPIQESIKNGDKKTGLTIMYMAEGMDTWDILKIEEIEIEKDDKTPDLFKKFEKFWPKLLVETLKWIINWSIKWKEQNDSEATYCSKISKTDWEIDFEKMTWDEIYNKYRAYYKWPGIYSFYNWKKINFEKIIFKRWDFIIDEWLAYWNILYFQNPKEIWIICKWWIIILKQVKLEWKKSINIIDFVNWNKDFLDYKF